MGFTGVIAVIFLFLAGGYRTIQKRWPGRWGSILPVWAHSNLSLAAAVSVAIHLGVGARDLGPLAILTWTAATLFTIAMISGSYGLLFTTTPSRRRRWVGFHGALTNVLYAAIIPHTLIKGFGSIVSAAVLITVAILLWKLNPENLVRLKTINWPLRKAHRSRG